MSEGGRRSEGGGGRGRAAPALSFSSRRPARASEELGEGVRAVWQRKWVVWAWPDAEAGGWAGGGEENQPGWEGAPSGPRAGPTRAPRELSTPEGSGVQRERRNPSPVP